MTGCVVRLIHEILVTLGKRADPVITINAPPVNHHTHKHTPEWTPVYCRVEMCTVAQQRERERNAERAGGRLNAFISTGNSIL